MKRLLLVLMSAGCSGRAASPNDSGAGINGNDSGAGINGNDSGTVSDPCKTPRLTDVPLSRYIGDGRVTYTVTANPGLDPTYGSSAGVPGSYPYRGFAFYSADWTPTNSDGGFDTRNGGIDAGTDVGNMVGMGRINSLFSFGIGGCNVMDANLDVSLFRSYTTFATPLPATVLVGGPDSVTFNGIDQSFGNGVYPIGSHWKMGGPDMTITVTSLRYGSTDATGDVFAVGMTISGDMQEFNNAGALVSAGRPLHIEITMK